ncbi:hypothetical protein BJY21_002732 [Kineosphaera limosa]|uniref:DUF4282 domain-containing protein n=1 Tax=Kineosphaera limosa NBRC 100340 TaxID=1184609 RepID=K6WBU2_9MICO|nr:hypothetical protein [Kineosphaera limosa]NYE01548.1 hypothetical protein [Kineosphaera limosa]GAB96705.1 hypothetical protein KILIM_045_00360 [Kineosphaera limosa NBRC 100340]
MSEQEHGSEGRARADAAADREPPSAASQPVVPASAQPADAASRDYARGWGAQSQTAYEQGHSGGWGGPGHAAATGPIPRFRHREPDPSPELDPVEPDPSEPDPAPELRSAPSPADSTSSPKVPLPVESHSSHSASRPVAGLSAEGGDGRPEAEDAGGGPTWAGEGVGGFTGRPIGFRRRVTKALAPIAMWIVIGYLLVDYMRTIYLASSAAALGAPADLGAVVVTVIAGLLKVVALACLARLFLEACVHLAELAARRGSPPA